MKDKFCSGFQIPEANIGSTVAGGSFGRNISVAGVDLACCQRQDDVSSIYCNGVHVSISGIRNTIVLHRSFINLATYSVFLGK